jgi:hypothetical protein
LKATLHATVADHSVCLVHRVLGAHAGDLLGVVAHLVLGERVTAPRTVRTLPASNSTAVTGDSHVETLVLGIDQC